MRNIDVRMGRIAAFGLLLTIPLLLAQERMFQIEEWEKC